MSVEYKVWIKKKPEKVSQTFDWYCMFFDDDHCFQKHQDYPDLQSKICDDSSKKQNKTKTN